MLISITKLHIKNLRSFKDEVFDFPVTSGLRLMTGENVIDLRLGANGCGKSSFWEAVCWVLFGTGVKGNKVSSLLKWGEEEAEVTITLTFDGDPVIIRRYGPPMKIEFEGKIVEQKVIDDLLGISKQRFLHSVIFGQGNKTFADLTVPDRGLLFDEVLSLDFWNKCSENAAVKHRALEADAHQLKTQISFHEGKLLGLQSEDSILANHELWETDRKNKLAELNKYNDEWFNNKQNQLTAKIEELETEERLLADVEQKLEAYKTDTLSPLLKKLEEDILKKRKEISKIAVLIGVIERGIKDNEKAAKFWRDNSTCDACKQALTTSLRDTKLAEFDDQYLAYQTQLQVNQQLHVDLSHEEIQLQSSFNQFSKEQKENEINKRTLSSKLKQHETSIQRLNAEAVAIGDEIQANTNPFTSLIEELETRVNPNIAILESIKVKRAASTEEKVALENKQLTIAADVIAAEYWKHGFKRIRLYYVNQILQALELEVEASASALGLIDWKISFTTEAETKSGSIKLGIQIKVTSPHGIVADWECWSGGESQRLRLAIAMGLASLIQRSAGVWFSFEVFDEPTNWLGGEGIEDLLEALRYRAETSNKSVWIVDHRALTFSGFSEIWSITKTIDEGSKIGLLA